MSQSLVVAARPVDPRPGARAAEYLTSPYASGTLAAAVTALAADLPARHPAARGHAAQVTALLAVGDQVLPACRTAVDAWRADGQPYPLGRTLLGLAESAAAAVTNRVEAAALAHRLGLLAEPATPR
ncbi:hypothetical protein JOD64_001292 [Micromonospora luteifusca]|uniref:Uncharacterized protein n=1 Tax=Micromonospora luteifusca TaxID=709860 RepID=A0ABS2LPF6_9ACTN|nr:hypothetical protein [Micromonospora luteifusca]MBM7490070.1 hypothetical protein [Micromonospora luteifusca]